MPGRGATWKEGGHVDETILSADIKDGSIAEADLDSALQAKVNSGGGGGKFYASLHWDTDVGAIGGSSNASFSPLLGVDGFAIGEQTDQVAGTFGRAVKITNVVITVNQRSTGSTNIELNKNGSGVKTYTFTNSDEGTIVTDSTETTFNSTDLIHWDINDIGGGNSVWTIIVEYDFS